MKVDIDKKTTFSIIGVLAVGVVLALAILFWTKEPGAATGESGRPQASAGKPGAHEGGHAEEQAILIAMTLEQVQRAGIVTARAGAARLDTTVILPGEVRFNEDRTAHIVPRVAGVAESVSASLGQEVARGQALATIASAELAELRSTALATDQRVALARTTYQREKKLWEDRISAQQDYQQAEQAYREAQIDAQSAKAKLDALGAAPVSGTLAHYVLRAPFKGVIVEKHLSQGEAVKEDANAFLVSDLSTVWVEVAVTANDLEYVRVGQAVTVKSTSGSATVKGKVSYVGSLLGERTRTATARVVIDNPGHAWRPGLFVNVALVRGKADAPVTVAADAVQTLEGKPVVFVKAANGFRAAPVSTGASDGKLVAITEGLDPGAEYVAVGSFVVKAEQAKGSAEHEH